MKYNKIVGMVCAIFLILGSSGGIYYWKETTKANAQLPPINTGFQPWEWEQVSEEGFGDLNNDYAWSMAVYSPPGSGKEYLYVGTLTTANVTNPPLPGQGCQIWRTDGTMVNGKYVWECVVGPTGSQAPAGLMGVGQFGGSDPSFAFGVRGMTVYNGLLWIGTAPLGEIFVTDGTTWKRANLPGFGVVNGFTSTRGITVYKGQIYAEAEDSEHGVRIFRYEGPTDFSSIGTFASQLAWVEVNYPGFDNTNYSKTAGELIVFDPPDDGKDEEYLYACTWVADAADIFREWGSLSTKGFEIWRTNGSMNLDGTLKWECVVGRYSPYGNEPGLGRANGGVLSAIVYNNMLYIGTANFRDGAEIWRTRDGVTWEPVELFGFGRTNGYIWRMIEYNGMLIVGTMNPFFGCEVWASDNGNPGTFRQVNINGMDASFNLPVNVGAFVGNEDGPIVRWADQYGVRSVAIYDGYLIVGTASWGDWVDRVLYPATNGTWHNLSGYVGCEIWRTDASLLFPEDMVVNKTVLEPSTGKWVDDINVSYYREFRFRCTIYNNNDTLPIQNLYAVDILPPGTTYVGGASIIYPDGHRQYISPHHIINLRKYIPQLKITILIWDLSDTEIPPMGNISLEYRAVVDKVYEFRIFDYKLRLLNTFFAFGTFGGLYWATQQRLPFVWGFDWDVVSIDVSMPFLVASVVDSPDPVQVGENLSYLIRVSNEGNIPAENVTLAFNYDSNYVLDIATPYPDVGDNIWEIGTLNPGENVTIELNGIVIGGEDIIANLIFSSSNGNWGNVIEETKVAYPDIGVLKLIKLTAPPFVRPGELIEYKILYYNPSDLNLTNVTVTEIYPEHTEFVTAYPMPSEGNNIWKVDNLPAHSGATMSVILRVSSPLDNGTTLNNRVYVTCDEGVDAEYSTSSIVISSPNLEISLAASQQIVQDERNVTYYISISNTGDMNATDVIVSWHYNDSLLTILSADGGVTGNGNITWQIDKLVAGQTLIYEVHSQANNVMEDTAMQTFAEAFCDTIYVRDNCTIIVKPVPIYEMNMYVAHAPGNVEPNATFNITLMIENQGNVELTNVTLHAMYGTNAQLLSSLPLPSGNDEWHIASLLPGETRVINMTMLSSPLLAEGDEIEIEFEATCNEGLNEQDTIAMEVTNEPPRTCFNFDGEFSIKNFLFFYTSYIIPASTTLRLNAVDEPQEGAAGVKETYIAIWRWDDTKSRWVCLQGWRKYGGEEIDFAKLGMENGYEAEGKYSISYYSIDNAGNREAFMWKDVIVC